MTQTERRVYLIKELLKEQKSAPYCEIPQDERGQKIMLRSLFNIRMPKMPESGFLKVQDEYLKEETRRKGITDISQLKEIKEDIFLWRGDITTLRCDAIVNAANSRMLGCFYPCHGCIDNAIHTFAGVQLRAACAEIMRHKGHDEEVGGAIITPAFNLPCRFVLHTVGPFINGSVTKNDEDALKSCYISCLKLADKNRLQDVAFCCISTGEFHFPNKRAAEIAILAVHEYKLQTHSKIKVIFNVYKQLDYSIYNDLLK